jgi:hypothetical protein
MNKLLYFIEKHKYGILITLFIHVGVFIYMQIKTYEEKVIYEAWGFRGRNIEAPDDIEISLDQIETMMEAKLVPDFYEEVTSHVTSANETRETSSDPQQFHSSYQGNAVQNVRDFERSVIQQLQGQRVESNASDASNLDVQDASPTDESAPKSTDGQAGSAKAYEGKTMVKYDLKDRSPLNNNDWHIRNPGYTCGNVNGIITVRIRVAPSGDVISARYVPEMSQDATSCMIQQAEKYALLSRFNFSASAEKQQEGTITYRFVYRRK